MDASWIELIKALAWPTVGFLALIYIWRSDAIGKLLRISSAVKELKERLSDLVDAEDRLHSSISSIGGFTSAVNELQEQLGSVRADVESIRDLVDQPTINAELPTQLEQNEEKLRTQFSDMNAAWQTLTEALIAKFDWFDQRSTGTTAYRFAHGNRKGPKLTVEQADEIAKLHSTIKSYRRRHADMKEWLNQKVRDDFVHAARNLSAAVSKL